MARVLRNKKSLKRDKKKYTKYALKLNPRNLHIPKRGGVRF